MLILFLIDAWGKKAAMLEGETVTASMMVLPLTLSYVFS
jgi:hypothetical protein